MTLKRENIDKMDILKRIDRYLKEDTMEDKYKCKKCGWVYDPKKEGKPFTEQPDSYKCPECGAPKSQFEKI